MWDELLPADPDLMRARWEEWGDLGERPIPPEIQERLWGAGAGARLEAWMREQRRKRIMRVVRYVPRRIINRTGLRPFLAKLRIVKA